MKTLQKIKLRFLLSILFAAFLVGCASLPPGSDFPKAPSSALAHPEETRLGRQFGEAANPHGGQSGFRLLTAGVDGFLARAQMINVAERTLDLQYFIFRLDETGKLLTEAVLLAADRGVRVRVLIDDADTIADDDKLVALGSHPQIEIRIFNPFAYRGHSILFRGLEFTFNQSRLDYRMHNKLFIVDNAIALVGGRNIGDEYFQIDPGSQFGDDDVFAAGPVVKELSGTFDEYWNCAFAIPSKALPGGEVPAEALVSFRADLADHHEEKKVDGTDYANRIASGEPLAGMISGRLPLVWAHVQLVYDSPDKKRVENGSSLGLLMYQPVADAASEVQSELLMVTPYFIPGTEGMQLLGDLRKRNVRVRILTNSLESANVLLAHSSYMHYRLPLLEDGAQLYEVRALLGNPRGSGQNADMASYGNYALHAKLIVFDRKRIFIGSMNFDQRSMHLNTEIGLIIDSPELARQTAARFEAVVRPENSYELSIVPGDGKQRRLVWRTMENGQSVVYDREPARNNWQRFKANFFSFLPLDREM